MSMRHYLRQKVSSVKFRFRRDGKDEPERVDGNLPLQLRHGSRVQFSEAPFLLAAEGSFVEFPGDETLVTAFSEFDLGGLKTFCLYLECREDEEQSAMLMLLMKEHVDEVDEIYLFQEQYELPLYHTHLNEVGESEDETTAVDFWLAKDEGVLGMPLFHTPEELSYERLWGYDEDRWLEPTSTDEQIILDQFGENTTQVNHVGTMLFGRIFEGLGGDIQEYLFTSAQRDDEGFRVRIWAGIPLTLADINLPDAL